MATVADITIKWSGKEYVISGLLETQTVLDLKEEIKKQTCVLPTRQKLLGLKHKGSYFAKTHVFAHQRPKFKMHKSQQLTLCHEMQILSFCRKLLGTSAFVGYCQT